VVLFHIARSMNLDMTRFAADYRSDSCRQVIAANISEALTLKLDGTPAAFLNGRQVFDMRVKSLNGKVQKIQIRPFRQGNTYLPLQNVRYGPNCFFS
jgi:predicted DsbA family dithiol-disulfide isomerase